MASFKISDIYKAFTSTEDTLTADAANSIPYETFKYLGDGMDSTSIYTPGISPTYTITTTGTGGICNGIGGGITFYSGAGGGGGSYITGGGGWTTIAPGTGYTVDSNTAWKVIADEADKDPEGIIAIRKDSEICDEMILAKKAWEELLEAKKKYDSIIKLCKDIPTDTYK